MWGLDIALRWKLKVRAKSSKELMATTEVFYNSLNFY